MARATAAEVLKLLGGSYPPGFNATNVGNLLDEADYILDTYVLKHYETSLSTTDTNVVAVANRIVVNLIKQVQWIQAGGALTGKPEPAILDELTTDRIDAVVVDTEDDGFGYVKMQGEYSE